MDENGGAWCTSDENERAEIVAGWAASSADQLLHCGYFKVGDMYRVQPAVLELYYHEENDTGIEDPIMYHTNARKPKYLNAYPYFEPGSFHLHTSGVDITFENVEGEYRASFLIREFRVTDKDGNILVENDEYSTHIFDYLFPLGVNAETLSMISWETIIDGHLLGDSYMIKKSATRKNVKKYEKEGGRYKKTKSGCFIKEKDEKEGKEIQCERKWQFNK